MGHHRHLPAQRLVDLRLPRAVIEMFVAADDVGDAHVVVVHHHGQHVSGCAVGAEQHEVVEIFVLPGHPALHLIVDDGFAGLRRPQPDHRLHAGRRFGRIPVAPAPVIKFRSALAPGRLPHFRQLFRRGVAAIGLSRREQLLGHFAMTGRPGELVDGVAVPFDPEPGQPVEDGVDRRPGGALAVGVLDPQQHLSAKAAGIEPIEQRRAASADMQEAGRGGREAGDDGLGHAVRLAA